MKKYSALFGLVLILVWINSCAPTASVTSYGGPSISQAQAEGPKLLIPQTMFDFGYVPPQSKISHYYLVKNVGEDTLKIEKVKPG